MDNYNELLEKYLQNEKKNRWFTTVVVVIFVVMAATIIFFAVQAELKGAQLERSYLQLEVLADSIARQTMADSLRQTSLISENRKLILLADSLGKLLEGTANQSKAADVLKVVDVLKLYTGKSKVVAYLQYRNDGEKQSIYGLASILRKNGYVVGAPEKVDTPFRSGVRFFNESDKESAKRIATIILENTNFGAVPIVPLLNYSAPANQIEIWINTNKAPQTNSEKIVMPPSMLKKMPSNNSRIFLNNIE